MAQITGGVVKYMRRVKTGDYEHKEAAAELSFSVGDGESYEQVYNLTACKALTKVNQILFDPQAAVANDHEPAAPAPTQSLPSPAPEAEAPRRVGRPRKSATILVDNETLPDPDVSKVLPKQDASVAQDIMDVDPADFPEKPTKVVVTKEVIEHALDIVATGADPADLGDLLSETPPPPVTDKELVSAITQHNEKIKNGTAIRALVGEYVPPPKTARDIPQDKRREFMERLRKLS